MKYKIKNVIIVLLFLITLILVGCHDKTQYHYDKKTLSGIESMMELLGASNIQAICMANGMQKYYSETEVVKTMFGQGNMLKKDQTHFDAIWKSCK